MPIDDDGRSPIGDVVEALTAFLSEAAEERPEGFASVERMRVVMPVEFYVRADPGGSGRVAAVDGRPPVRTWTTMMPVLHGLSLEVEVIGAGQREPGVES